MSRRDYKQPADDYNASMNRSPWPTPTHKSAFEERRTAKVTPLNASAKSKAAAAKAKKSGDVADRNDGNNGKRGPGGGQARDGAARPDPRCS